MIIRVEPKDFFMSTIFLIFTKHQPDPEDADVKRYLAERALEPKRTSETTFGERDCLVWQFGGCYLGRHLDAIADIQKKFLEEEVLAEGISRLLKEGTDVELREATDVLPDASLQELIGSLVKEFHQDSSFGSDADGNVTVTLEPVVVQRRFRELLQSRPHQGE
jgi:hypothetical protein